MRPQVRQIRPLRQQCAAAEGVEEGQDADDLFTATGVASGQMAEMLDALQTRIDRFALQRQNSEHALTFPA